MGLWIGIDTGDFAAAALCVLTWLLVNWRKEVAKAQERMALGRLWRCEWGGSVKGVRGEVTQLQVCVVPLTSLARVESRTPLHANRQPAVLIHTPPGCTPAHDYEHNLGHLARMEGYATRTCILLHTQLC